MSDEIKVRFVGEDAGLSASVSAAGRQLDTAGNAANKFGKTLGQLEQQLKNFREGLRTATNPESFDRIQRAIEATKGRIEALSKVNPISPDLAKQANRSTEALGNLSRIAQDAPYGFIGIANNINPLLESFQRLQAETGSTSGALKGMLGALTGPAGIGLAVGVVSSLLVKFGDDLFSSSTNAKYLADDLKNVGTSADNIRKDIQALASDLQFLNQVSALKIQIAGGSDVDVLKRQIERADFAIAQLGQTRESLEREKNGIIDRVARAPVGSDESKQAQAALDKINEAIQASIDQESDIRKGQIIMQQQSRLAEKRINEQAVKDAEEASKKRLAALKKQQAEYAALIKAKRQSLREEIPTDLSVANLVIDDTPIKNAFDRVLAYEKPLTINPRVNVAPEIDDSGVQKMFDEIDIMDMNRQLSEAINSSMKNISIDAFSGLGEALGAAISGGDLSAVFTSLGQQLGAAVSALGQQFIKIGVTMLAAQKAFAALLKNPFAAIASGVALTALGAAIKNFSIPKLAGGGIIPPGFEGDRFPAFLNSGEAVIPLDKLRSYIPELGGGVVVLTPVLRGRDIHLQQEREKRSQRRSR